MKQAILVREAVAELNAIRDDLLTQNPKATIPDCWDYLESVSPEACHWAEKEILRCRKDFRWLAGNYLPIFQPRGGGMPMLDLNDSQELVLETIEYLWNHGKPGWILVHKARQMGISTLSVALMVWQSVFYRQRTSMIIAQDPPHATYELSIFTYQLFNLPWWMRPNVLSEHIQDRLILAVKDESGYGGLNNWVVAASANKMSAFAQGKPITACHLTELSDWPEEKLNRIIDEDLGPAMVSRPGTIALYESKPRGASGSWYKMWHHFASMGNRGVFTSMFIPVFFEKSRKVKVPPSFRPTKEEMDLRQRYAFEWKKCSTPDCNANFYTGGSEQAECLRCGGMEGTPVIITDEQLGWYRQMKSACHSKEKLKRFKASFAVTAEEGFQFYGSQVFPEDVYDWVRENAIAPKWTGEFANEDFTGSGTVWHAQKGTYCERCKAKHCPHCHQDHSDLEMHYKIWEWPQKGRRYHLAIDSAYGMDQGDFGVVTVIKIGHGLGEADEQVAEYRAVIDGEAIAIHGYILAKLYNDCVMAPEVRSGPGEATLLQLRKMGVSNIWMWKHPDSKNILSNKLGWVTQSNTKPKLITHFISWSRQRILKIRSLDFLYEMPSFIKESDDDDSGRSTGGRKDDCVTPDTLIRTMSGLKPIVDVRPGDMVLTHTGTYKKVLRVGARPETQQVLALSSFGKPTLRLTDNHRMMLYPRKWVKSAIAPKNLAHDEGQWISYSQDNGLRNYGSGYPIPREVIDINTIPLSEYAPQTYSVVDGKLVAHWSCKGVKKINPKQNLVDAEVELTPDFLRLIGYFCAEGCVGRHNVAFASNTIERSVREWCKSTLGSLGLRPSESRASENGRVVSCGSVPFNAFFSTFGSRQHKYLPKWATLLPPEKQFEILLGYLSGDSSVTAASGEVRVNSISVNLAFQMYEIALRCGYPAKIRKQNGQNGNKTQWVVTISGPSAIRLMKADRYGFLLEKPNRKQNVSVIDKDRVKLDHGSAIGGIRKVEFDKYEGLVYNLSVEGDESYVANGVTVHNCIMANLIAAYTSHDEDWDYDSGRVIIPGRYRPGVATLDGNIGNYMVTCMRGHKMNVENPARWECPECRKAEDIAVFAQSAIKINAQSPQRTIDLTKGRIPDLHEVLATAQQQDQFEIV